MNNTIKDLVLNALVAALYIVLVIVFNFLSFEAIQFRIAEALLILVLFNKRLLPGLVIGTFLANLFFSPFGIIDATFGTLATLFSLILMIIFKKIPFLSLIFPALSNGIIIGIMITYFSQTPFLINFLLVFLGEVVVMYTIGIIFYLAINKNEYLKDLIN